MIPSTADIDAARRLIDALDMYRLLFDAMVEAGMDVARYEAVSACLADIRSAKEVIFAQVASESVDFVLAHTSLMTGLWNSRLAAQRGDAATLLDAHSSSLRLEHDEAIDRLRLACQRVLKGRRMPDAPRPSPSPENGA